MHAGPQPYGSVTYQYDATGNRTRLTWSDGMYVAYDYDNASRVTKIRENGATSGIGVLATYTYDTLGRRTNVFFGNGTTRDYEYDAVDRLIGVKLNLAGTTNDLILGRIGGTGTAIAYNPASQIMSLARSNDAYAYTGKASVNRNYTANGLNQYTLAGSVGFAYDGRGNLTSSDTSSYTYSKLNELKTAPGVSAMTYDGIGRLINYTASASTRFVYSGGSLVQERNSVGTTLKRYVPGPGTDEVVVWYEGSGTADRRFLQADERGSIIAVSDAAGTAIGLNRYDEYGIPQSTNIGRFQYTGQTWFPEAGLYNFKARFYSPTLGRFMQTDPIGYADGLNWYNYVGGDPINRFDPDGLEVEIVVTGKPTAINVKIPDLSLLLPQVPIDLWGYSNAHLGAFSNSDSKVKPQKGTGPCPLYPTNSTDLTGQLATVAGLVLGTANVTASRLSGGGGSISFGNNAVQFTGGRFGQTGRAVTLGNTTIYGPGSSPSAPNARYDGSASNATVGDHERQHTYQWQSGGLFLGSYLYDVMTRGQSKTRAETAADNGADVGC